MLNAEDWLKLGRICCRLIDALENEEGFTPPVTVTISELEDRERVLVQLVWRGEGGKVDFGPLCPIRDQIEPAEWPLYIQVEDAAGKWADYSLELPVPI
jgi:hypothetical protein